MSHVLLPLPLSISPRSLHPRAFPDFSPPRALRESAVSVGTPREGDLGRKDLSEEASASVPSSSLLALSRRYSLSRDHLSSSFSLFPRIAFLTSFCERTSDLLGESPTGSRPPKPFPVPLPYTRTYRTRGASFRYNSPIFRVRAPPRSRYAFLTNRHGTFRRVNTDISVGFR